MTQPFHWWIIIAMVLGGAAALFLCSWGTTAQALDRASPLRRFFTLRRAPRSAWKA